MKKPSTVTIAYAILLFSCLFQYTWGTESNIHIAAGEGDTETIRTLIAEGIDLDEKIPGGWTAMMICAKYGNVDIMEMLLRAKADVNATNDRGNSALMVAVTAQRVQAVKMLLANNANVQIKNKAGMDAIEIARVMGHAELLDLLEKYQTPKG